MGCPECQDGLEAEACRYGAAAVDVDSESAHAREGDEGAGQPGKLPSGCWEASRYPTAWREAATGAGLGEGGQSECRERRRQWVAAAVGALSSVCVLPGHQVVAGTAQPHDCLRPQTSVQGLLGMSRSADPNTTGCARSHRHPGRIPGMRSRLRSAARLSRWLVGWLRCQCVQQVDS
jgi:hypothetical protein